MSNDSQKSLGQQPSHIGRVDRIDSDTDDKSLSDDVTQVGNIAQTGPPNFHQDIVELADRYQLERTLGRGGMGQVDLATDLRLGRRVAIKRIHEKTAASSSSIERFLTEAKAIAALNHPNIVQIHDFGWTKDGPFFVMEYVDGGSLLELCQRGSISIEHTVDIVCKLCDGLKKAHDAGIIHRDIKPANILMTKDGIPKLTDFGLAKAKSTDVGMTLAGMVLGTLDFMPAEQRQDASLVDARSDLWSLAATLYQMVTGESPRVIDLDLCPRNIRSVFAKGLKTKKEDRYQSASEFRDALRISLGAAKGQFSQTMIDLGKGECPSCNAVNESHRKFCRECGNPLRCKCLKCHYEIPVWDKVCPECGGKQTELAAKLIDELGQKRERAEKLCSELRFDAAIALAMEVAQVTDRRTSTHRDWAVEFTEVTGQEQARQVESARLLFEEAQKNRAAFDYTTAIQAIEAIPKPLRSQEMSAFLAKLHSESSESDDLLVKIKVRMENRDLDELLPLVERALMLRGDREDLRQLAAELSERNEAFGRAARLLSEGNADEALRTVKPVSAKLLTPAQKILLTKLEEISSIEGELREMVRHANADGMIDSADIVGLLPKALAYWRLNPNNQKFLKLRDDLLARTGRVPAELLLAMPQDAISQLPSEVRESLFLLTNSIGMRLKMLPAGTFTMGDWDLRKATPHQVVLTQPFYLAIYQVTQEQYQRVMGHNPSKFEGLRNPVDSVSWEEAMDFCRKLSAMPEEKAAGRVYRLPTEAEWEYACRAGTTTKYSFGDDEAQLGQYAWFATNSKDTTHPVGQKKPNAWGLYDIHGNVWEWCADWYGDYPESEVSDPIGPSGGSIRVVRGGSWYFAAASCSVQSASRNSSIFGGDSWYFGAASCRSAFRYWHLPSYRLSYVGFRVALSPSGIPKFGQGQAGERSPANVGTKV